MSRLEGYDSTLNDEIHGIHENICEEAARLYEDAINWLHLNYFSYQFFAERDIVWTLQLYLLREIERRHLRLKVFDNYKMPNKIHVDLAILEQSASSVLIVAELKYEPDHARVDIFPGKLSPSKVFWDSERNHGVLQDINRIETLIGRGLSEIGYVTFIDEGGHHAYNSEPEGSIWNFDWGKSPYSQNIIAVLLFKRWRE